MSYDTYEDLSQLPDNELTRTAKSCRTKPIPWVHNLAKRMDVKLYQFQYNNDPKRGFYVVVIGSRIKLQNSKMTEYGKYAPDAMERLLFLKSISDKFNKRIVRNDKDFGKKIYGYTIDSLWAGGYFIINETDGVGEYYICGSGIPIISYEKGKLVKLQMDTKYDFLNDIYYESDLLKPLVINKTRDTSNYDQIINSHSMPLSEYSDVVVFMDDRIKKNSSNPRARKDWLMYTINGYDFDKEIIKQLGSRSYFIKTLDINSDKKSLYNVFIQN